MTWFRIDDGFAFHRKTVEAGNAAIGLWTRAGAWSSAAKTGGHVPRVIATSLGTSKQAQRLVEAGLWKHVSDGYQFRDWQDYNPTKREANAAQRKRSVGGKLGNHRKWHEARGIKDDTCMYCDDD